MRLLRILLLAALSALAAVLLVYWTKDPERRTMNDEARAGVPGQFIRLADGVTHYETAGPDTGRAVVLAAAFSVPAYLSDSLFQRLGRAGFRVIRFDYYGRGWSDRPMVAYDLGLFDRQLAGLLDSLGVTAPIDLVGLSFGAAIVTDFADRHPDRVRSLIYIDPVFNTGRQLPPEERSALAWDWHMVFGGGTNAMAAEPAVRLLLPRSASRLGGALSRAAAIQGDPRGVRRTRAAIAVAPHQGAATSEDRRTPAAGTDRLGPAGRTGAPFSESAALLGVLPQATLVPVDSAGHLPHLDQPDVVDPRGRPFPGGGSRRARPGGRLPSGSGGRFPPP